MKQIANIFTLLNLIFGCLAIVVTLQNGIVIHYTPDGGQIINIPEKIVLASLFIGLAAVVDFLDGFVARALKVSSELGKQLDSLADVVSFGVAPSVIIYQLLRMGWAGSSNGINITIIYLVPAFLIAAAAAYRLAKFNLDEGQRHFFKGVPTPAIGMLIASFPLIYWYQYGLAGRFISSVYFLPFLYVLILLLCFLMISNIPMFSFKIKTLVFKSIIHIVILLLIAVISFVIFFWLAIPIVFISYLILSVIFKRKFL